MRAYLPALFLCASTACFGQMKVNPQAGLTFVNLTNDQNNYVTEAALGWQLGLDLRLGDRLYFQPGAYFGRSATYIKFIPLDTTFIEDNLIRTTAKVKALVGYDLIHGDNFKLRVNAGPTYEVLLSVDSKDDKIDFNKDDYASGSFNMDGGIGLDLSVVTLEAGLSYGLSNAYKDTDQLSGNSKYFGFYATLGVVLGGGK